ncbi:MAG: transporter large permease [Geminicoccaceae bacterium]|nr:transporter large permease [Geminicoccaceae bacterium]
MSELQQGLLIAVVTIAVLLSGAPVAFCLGIVAIGFLVWAEGLHALGFVPDIFYGALDSFALLSIPMFILMGGAVASSRFAALSGSSPATCAAIGKMGVPEMRRRGYPDGVATGSIAAGGTLGILIPPSITLIVYGIATETSISAGCSRPGFCPA